MDMLINVLFIAGCLLAGVLIIDLAIHIEEG